MTDWAGFDEPLTPEPRFPVEPKHRQPGDEREYQQQFRKELKWLAPRIMSWGVPNGGHRGLKAQRQAKMEGLTTGVHDEHYAWDRALAVLEWKDGQGDLSAAQIDWGNAMVERGFRVACVRTPAFALALFREWGAPVRDAR